MQQQKQHNQRALAEPTGVVKFMKIILIILNVGVLVLGIIALAIGIWSLTGEYGTDNIEVIMHTDLFTAGSVLLITGGSVIIVAAFLGAFGALFANRTMLGIYFVIMVIFCLVFITGATIVFFFLDEIEYSLASKMEATLKNNYEVNTTSNKDNNAITIVWNDIQRELKCCGVRGGLTSHESWFMWQSSTWFDTEGSASMNPDFYLLVPSSCCATNHEHIYCQVKDDSNHWPPKSSPALVIKENPAMYHTGCLDKLEDKIMEHIVGLSVVAVLTFILIIVCAVFSLLVYMEAGRIGKVL